jgi:hypothetical protein
MELKPYPHLTKIFGLESSVQEEFDNSQQHRQLSTTSTTQSSQLEKIMNSIMQYAVKMEIQFRNVLIKKHDSFFARLKDDRGDVPGWVLVVLMTTGLVTAIWTIAAPRLTAILKNSLDSMNGIR